MRPILFRGKRKSDGLWVKGYYGEFHSRPIIPEPNSCQIFEPREDAYFCGSCIGGTWHVVVRDTVGQFTGLCDKNGKKIFEGDIVRAMMDYGPAGMIESVVGIYFESTVGGYQWNYFDVATIEVIGNIHDNPELLKGDKNV